MLIWPTCTDTVTRLSFACSRHRQEPAQLASSPLIITLHHLLEKLLTAAVGSPTPLNSSEGRASSQPLALSFRAYVGNDRTVASALERNDDA